jgi:hypothetical protein
MGNRDITQTEYRAVKKKLLKLMNKGEKEGAF